MTDRSIRRYIRAYQNLGSAASWFTDLAESEPLGFPFSIMASLVRSLRADMYLHLGRVARETQPDIELALCLEDPAVWKAIDTEVSLGRCNCVL